VKFTLLQKITSNSNLDYRQKVECRALLNQSMNCHSEQGIADLMDDFERETAGFTFKIIPLLSNALSRM
jgi:hypothetical protein